MIRRARLVAAPRRTGRRGWLAQVVAGIAVIGVVTGCSGGPAADPSSHHSTDVAVRTTPTTPTDTSPPPKPRKPPPPPRVGACHRIGYRDISHYSNAAAVVPCSQPHSSYTFTVKRLPRNVVPGVSIGNRSIQQPAATACRNAFRGFIGGQPADRALSRLTVTYFLPDQRGFDLGARWIRCDVIALQGPSALAPLPPGSPHLLLDRSNALHSYGVCSTGDPGTGAAKLEMCTQPHAYRALIALRLGTDKQRYPGLAVTREGGQTRCQDYLRNTLGLLGGYTFAWTYPTVADWRAGQRFGFCWKKTPH